MAILPLGISRVSNLLTSQVTAQSIESTQAQLLTVENQLSTGERVNVPSDDPAAASMIMQLNQTLAQRSAYANNINSASSQLGETDSTLGDLGGLLQQAQQIASANVGTNVTDAQRQSASAIVQSIYSQAESIANKAFNGSYLFGGDGGSAAPFTQGPAGMQYTGTGKTLSNSFDVGMLLSYQVSAPSVFGGAANPLGGNNVTPDLGAQTPLNAIAGTTGHGIRLGAIQISDGTVTKTVDLSSAANIGDVINLINNAAVGTVTASISGQALAFSGSPTENISISDVGGTTAADLGITTPVGGAGVGVTATGLSMNPRVTPMTSSSDLRNGAGLDNAGLIITNGTITKTVSWAPGASVQTILNTINAAGVGVSAKINPSGTGITIVNATQGTDLSIAENGGQTAAQLGVRTYSPAIPLAQLNDGKGVGTAGVGKPDFQITAASGVTFAVSLSGAQTVQDVLNTINAAIGGAVTAGFATSGNGIVLTDTTAGAGTLTVTSQNFSTAAADLGLTTPASGNTITGTDVGSANSGGLFGNLTELMAGLQSGNQAQITAAGTGIQSDIDRVTEVQGQTGAVEQELTSRTTQMNQENVATKSFISQLQDTDFTTAITKFQTLQTALQASYQTAAKELNLSLLNFL
jgi:flagellar hook-associated protein 3 FlgL